MKHFMKSAKSICALVLSVVLIMSMSTVAFAADSTADTSDEISAILASINAEYGTNIHVLSDNELAKYGLTNAEPQSMPNYEQVDLEETLRYIAEVQIPQFERTTEEAIAVMESVVYVGKYSTSSIGLNNGYSNSVFVEDFYNNFNINERNYLNQFTVSAEQFTSQGTTSSTISDSYIYLSSQEEIATICGGTATEFSDLVLDYLSIFGEGNYYFVRDLGSNLNSVTCYTQGGGELNQAPTSTLGMRFTIQVNEFVCLE